MGWRKVESNITYLIEEDISRPTPLMRITCRRCSMTSYSEGDVRHRYCGNCHQYHDAMAMEQNLNRRMAWAN